MLRLIKRTAGYALIFALGGLAVFVLGDVLISLRLPELKPWHTIRLEQEFRADMAGTFDWQHYLEQEQRLFDELGSHRPALEQAIELVSSRFIAGGNRFQRRVPGDWNRSYRLDADNPSGVALLVHGLSDSPYSLRSIARLLNSHGIIVYGLRLPGHGTLPSGLDGVTWQDWLAAVRIVDAHIRRHHAGLPYYFAGYSTGAALGVKMTLDTISAGGRPPQQLFLFSPALGVSPLARFANLHRVLSHLEQFEKARWLNVLPEYDPYKYNSFTKNAGKQVSLLVNRIYTDIAALKQSGRNAQLPTVISFQSLVDATVSTVDLIDKLYAAIDNEHAELVLFDINQVSYFKELITYNPDKVIEALLHTGGNYRLTLVTNRDDATRAVAEIKWGPDGRKTETPLALAWPEDVYSLSHTSITFRPDDPVYGYAPKDARGQELLTLGNLSIRGEQGVLSMPAATLLRLRANPFYEYIEQRISAIVQKQAGHEPVTPDAGPGT